MGDRIRALFLVLSLGLFSIALFLPAADIEGIRSGLEAFVIGYFCAGIVFLPSHLFCVLGWISLARRAPVEATKYGFCALYGPLLWLGASSGARSLSFPSGWVWLTSVLILVSSGALLDTPREPPGKERSGETSEWAREG